MRCDTVLPYLTSYAAGELRPHISSWVQMHLRACPACEARASHSAELTSVLRSLRPDAIEPPAGLAEAVLARTAAEPAPSFLGQKLWPLPFVAGEQIGRLPSAVGKLVAENKDVAGVAGTALVAAGAAWIAWRAVGKSRARRPATS